MALLNRQNSSNFSSLALSALLAERDREILAARRNAHLGAIEARARAGRERRSRGLDRPAVNELAGLIGELGVERRDDLFVSRRIDHPPGHRQQLVAAGKLDALDVRRIGHLERAVRAGRQAKPGLDTRRRKEPESYG